MCRALQRLSDDTKILYDGANLMLIDADHIVACCIGPTLLGSPDPDRAELVHDLEVFGPAATLIPYRDETRALNLPGRGDGSLVVSLYGSDASRLSQLALELADYHGRVHVVSLDTTEVQTGHRKSCRHRFMAGPVAAKSSAESAPSILSQTHSDTGVEGGGRCAQALEHVHEIPRRKL